MYEIKKFAVLVSALHCGCNVAVVTSFHSPACSSSSSDPTGSFEC